jgi:GT2 family glycosyltransferase
MRLSQEGCAIDVLVLDDCSPEPGWSEELRALCHAAGAAYYRSPRNLGIPRNVNLGLLAAERGGYDYVVICNSDVILPANLVIQLIQVARSDSRIGSVTAWSNNVSAFSLPNQDANRYLADQQVVDWVTRCLTHEFGAAAMDVPAAVSFCVLIPVDTLRVVGLMDPVFGRGYCEETDWSLRSQAAGYRIALAPSVFVYHRGQVSTVAAGLVASGHTTVPAHEAIVATRYPLFPSQVRNFLASDVMSWAQVHAFRALICKAAREHGYVLQLAWMGAPTPPGEAVRVVLDPRGHTPVLELSYLGFSWRLELGERPLLAELRELLGGDPSDVIVSGFAGRTRALAGELAEQGIAVRERMMYPESV